LPVFGVFAHHTPAKDHAIGGSGKDAVLLKMRHAPAHLVFVHPDAGKNKVLEAPRFGEFVPAF
jgi:hypothetical protein